LLLGRGRVLPSRRPRDEGEEKGMSEQEGDRLSLEGLAQRLEALARENEQMRSENAELRGEVSALRGSGTRRGERSLR
jgi:cell division septum initiation protein DivIVA